MSPGVLGYSIKFLVVSKIAIRNKVYWFKNMYMCIYNLSSQNVQCSWLYFCLFQPSDKSLLWFAFCCCHKYHDQDQLGEERNCLLLSVTVHHHRKPGQKLKAGARSRNHGGMLLPGLSHMTCSSRFLIQPRNICLPRVALLTEGCILFHQWTVRTMPHRPIWWREGCNRNFLILSDSRLGQVGDSY